MEPDLLQDRQTEINKLEQSLKEAVTATEFFDTPVGRLWERYAAEEITKAIKDLTSDKYDKDHGGYLARKAELNAYKTILRKMQVAGSPIRIKKINEKLKELDAPE